MEPDPKVDPTTKLSSCVIGVLAKAPIAGRVKTRLQSIWSPEDCARFQDACLRDTLARARRISTMMPVIVVEPIEEGTRFARSLPFPLSVRAQCDGDLGARIAAAFEHLLRETGASAALLVGSDSPDLPDRICYEAADALGSNDMALSPSSDGGYCLIGLRRDAVHSVAALTRVFEEVPWSSSETLLKQRARAESLGLTVALVSPWTDVDDPADVERLRARLLAMEASERAPAVARFLAEQPS